MAKSHGKSAAFKLDNAAGSLQDLSTYCDTAELQRACEQADVTSFGDGNDKFVPGVKGGKIPIGGAWDPTLDAHMDGLIGIDATSSWELGPEGTTSGKVKYSGECRIENYTWKSGVKARNEWSAEFVLDGAVTRGTWP